MREAAERYVEKFYPDADRTLRLNLILAFLDGAICEANKIKDIK